MKPLYMWISGIAVLLVLLTTLLTQGDFSTRSLWIAGGMMVVGILVGLFFLKR